MRTKTIWNLRNAITSPAHLFSARPRDAEQLRTAAVRMPNTGMLDHRAYGRSYPRRSRVHWMEQWPSRGGYTTARSSRVAGFSRHLFLRSLDQPSLAGGSRPASSTPRLSNSVSPFHTSMKPTCGYFFSRDTDNKKRRIGIPSSNLVAWRSQFGHTHQHSRAQTAC